MGGGDLTIGSRLARDARRNSPLAALLLLVVLVGCTACGSTQPATGAAPGSAGPSAPATGGPSWAPVPAAGPDGPSESALQVCSPDDGQKDIAAALGVTPTRVEQPTWSDHLYACRYTYPNGSFELSVKELPGDAQTLAYLDQLAAKLGKLAPVDGIGETAFYTREGSIVARKDFKVLLVDISGLPATFGDPPASRASVSHIIAAVIMSCWSGA